MRTIERTTRFKRDYKREIKGRHRATIENDLVAVLALLANDVPLEDRYRDHALTGEWKDHRDCSLLKCCGSIGALGEWILTFVRMTMQD